MRFWYFMFFCDLLIPVLMIIGGRMMWRHTPKSINGVIGYRTRRSMKNKDTWKFAHDYCGRLWWRIGWVMLIPSVIIHFPFYNSSKDAIGLMGGALCSVQCIVLVASIIPTERALKRNFTDSGMRRHRIEIHTWLDSFLQILQETFGERIWFVGLQGSYGRGEATETSDIDLVVILDTLSVSDIQKYNDMLDTFKDREIICGFLSGKDELLSWETSDLFQFYYDTKPLRGSLDELLIHIDDAAINRAVKTGACNIYHACVHNMLYEKDEEILKGLYKSASFVVQAICFTQTGKYITLQKDLLGIVNEEERRIIEIFLNLKNGGAVDFGPMSETLFLWSKGWIR